jgi:hypothetical protein
VSCKFNLKQKIAVLMTFILCMVLLACTAPLPPRQPTETPQNLETLLTCGDNQRIVVGDYVLNNNVWNKGEETDYMQCVFAQRDTPPAVMGWRWAWPGTGRQVKAYPEVMVGNSPWDDAPTTGELPVPVTDRDIFVTYDASVQASGRWNVALEMWLTSALPPAEGNITDEVMIWVDANELTPGPPTYDILMIDGAKYSLHISYGHGDASGGSAASWSYIAFYSRESQLAATLNLGKFLDYLLENEIIQENRYVASIEMGTEVASGTGEFVLSNYAITMP